MNRPILLWMTSRSRSSMVSSIFAKHGIFWGNTQVTDPAGYQWFENQNIKKLQTKFRPRWSRPNMQPVSGNDPNVFDEFQAEIAKVVPLNKTWLMKTGVEYFPAYEALKPYNIFIKRPIKDVANSLCSKRPDTVYSEAIKIITWRFNYMDELQKTHGGVFVNTDDTIGGNFASIKDALTYCGINYNEELVKQGISK